jgi:hypothetical protein
VPCIGSTSCFGSSASTKVNECIGDMALLEIFVGIHGRRPELSHTARGRAPFSLGVALHVDLNDALLYPWQVPESW